MGSGFRSCVLSVVVLAALTVCGCPDPHHPEAPVDADAAPPGVDQQLYSGQDAAGQACLVLRFLHCPEGDPPDVECADSIRQLVSIGTFERTNVLCIRTARTVDRVRKCDVDCEQ